MRALVVDDSKANRLLLQRFLGEAGFETVEAENGSDGLWYLNRIGPVELITVDFHMPGMNGVEFVRAVRSQRRYSDVPMIMITSEKSPKLAVDAFGAGVDELLIKPFTKETILEKLGSMRLTPR